MFREPEANEETIQALDAYLQELVLRAREAWSDASYRYQQDFRLASKKENDRLLRAVKSAKRAIERSEKLQTIYKQYKGEN